MLAILLCGTGLAAAQTRYTAGPESEVVIHGTSTVNEFACEAGRINAGGLVEPPSVRGSGSSPAPTNKVDVHVRIPVESLDCGKRPMNTDMYRALEGEAHPTIHFELTEVRLTSTPEDSAQDIYRFDVRGDLTIAGTRREITIDATGAPMREDEIRIAGRIPLRMTTFGVTPPTALLGLVKARDQITVVFDLVARPAGSAETYSPATSVE